MDRFVIRGGVPLRGEVVASGSKNSALALMAPVQGIIGIQVVFNIGLNAEDIAVLVITVKALIDEGVAWSS